MGKPYDTFRIMLKQIDLEDFFRNSYFGHFLDLLEKYNARFQMTMVYELLKRRFIFQNPEKKDEAWAFEVIPLLRYQVTAEEEISSPRILRWLRANIKTVENPPNLYNPPHDARGLKVIPSKNVRHPYTPHAKRRKKSFIKAIQNLKKKIFGELPMAVGEEVLEFKHVNVYKRVSIAQKNKLIELSRSKDLRAQYDMHFFSGEDFRTMTSIKIWWEDWYIDEILTLIRERHVRYHEYYDSTNRILDLNFYFNFKLRYDKISKEATTFGGRSLTQLINEFKWNEDMINYVRGISPYPGGMDWIGAKRILTVMNMNKTHFVTLEILLHEGCMNVYDCQLMGMEHAKFLTSYNLCSSCCQNC
ncbi:hypothetical protein KY284_001294 [Solanum tuberosum]|nr:hypothetical protein KY284_001294 [Solanum tuberosum]